jgi:hypothetical protein
MSGDTKINNATKLDRIAKGEKMSMADIADAMQNAEGNDIKMIFDALSDKAPALVENVEPTKMSIYRADLVNKEEAITTIEDVSAEIQNLTPQTEAPKERKAKPRINDIDLSVTKDDVEFSKDINNKSIILGREMTESEAVLYLKRLTPQLPFKNRLNIFLKQLIGKSLTANDLNNVQFLSRAQVVHRDNGTKQVWGFVSQGARTIVYDIDANGNKVFYANTISHESFHNVYRHYLTAKERLHVESLIKSRAIKDGVEVISPIEIEEYGADLFEKYAKDKFRTKISLFDKILSFLGFTKEYNKDLDSVFEAIDKGTIKNNYFYDATESNSSAIAFMEKDLSDFTDLDKVIKSKDIVSQYLTQLLYQGIQEGNNRFLVTSAEILPMLQQKAISEYGVLND